METSSVSAISYNSRTRKRSLTSVGSNVRGRVVGMIDALREHYALLRPNTSFSCSGNVVLLGRDLGSSDYEKAVLVSNVSGFDDSIFTDTQLELAVLKQGKEVHIGASSLWDDPDLRLVVVTNSDELNVVDREVLLRAVERGVKVVSLPSLYEQVRQQLPLHLLDGAWMANELSNEKMKNKRVIRRLMDLVVASGGLLFLALVFPLVAFGIKLTGPGSIIYSQRRVGLDGAEFDIYKFRTMKVDAESCGAVWASENDSRVTKFGTFLRRSRLDELPQFWNVIRGDMSVIGPRPERPEFVALLREELPFYDFRHKVLPGITGWAQVKFPYGASVSDSLEKLKYDLFYLKNRTLFMDLVILLKTGVVMLNKIGSR